MHKQDNNKYELIIIGAGPAGLTASIYASRYKIQHLVIGSALGGMAFEAHKICNFPGEENISGIDLITKMQKHAESFGAKIMINQVTDLRIKDKLFEVVTQDGKSFFAQTILLGVGTKRRQLGLKNEDNLIGKGVSYCATCDAMFYKEKVVAVVGGSDSANTASLYLSEIAKQVYQIYRRGELRGASAWVEQIKNKKNIELILNTEVRELIGSEKLEKVVLTNPYNGSNELQIDGLFVEIGSVPDTSLAQKIGIKLDNNGYIDVGNAQETSIQGIWAAGDITNGSNNFHQIITACSEAAIACESIFKYLKTENSKTL